MSQSQYLEVALQAVKKAEEVINKYYLEEIRATLKEDQSPVTVADQQAEQIISQYITSIFPEHGILGEEAGEKNSKASHLWIIDPIDGTKNYLRKIPLFATQLALMVNGEVELGVSNATALGELLYAEKGKGAWLNEKQIHVSSTRSLSESYLSFGSIPAFETKKLMNPLLELNRSTNSHRGFGDFWSYHLLAQGKIDIMVEAATKIWDIAAISLIVEEAGGKVTDLSGKPISESTTSIIATNGYLHEAVINYFE